MKNQTSKYLMRRCFRRVLNQRIRGPKTTIDSEWVLECWFGNTCLNISGVSSTSGIWTFSFEHRKKNMIVVGYIGGFKTCFGFFFANKGSNDWFLPFKWPFPQFQSGHSKFAQLSHVLRWVLGPPKKKNKNIQKKQLKKTMENPGNTFEETSIQSWHHDDVGRIQTKKSLTCFWENTFLDTICG